MITEFYKKALPSNGVYCITAIDPITKIPKHKFVESINDIEPVINEFKSSDVNHVPKQIEVPANSFIRDSNGASAILSINRIEANLMNRFYALLDRYKKIKEDEDA